ncbi:hypothetical protein [Janthinobacterium sp. TND4EL3]|nr:hypothetical protein [Janthinobacterium sp. TND4EL3]
MRLRCTCALLRAPSGITPAMRRGIDRASRHLPPKNRAHYAPATVMAPA